MLKYQKNISPVSLSVRSRRHVWDCFFYIFLLQIDGYMLKRVMFGEMVGGEGYSGGQK